MGSCRRYASAMLPNVFRPDTPTLALELPLETEQALEALLNKLPLPRSRPMTVWAGAISSGKREERRSAAADEAGWHQGWGG